MGTTLTGLTPATTYDALIKVGDNGPLSATAKYVGDGLGNDSVVALSTSSVGIGTTSPTQLLHVAGNVRITGALYDGNNAAGTSGQILSSTGTGTDWVSKSDLSLVDGSGTANYVSKWSDTDTLTNSLIYDNGTNVGIGTTSPVYKLQINASGGNGISLLGDVNNEASVLFGDSGSAVIGRLTYSNIDDSMRIFTNGSERVRIDSSGLVGIGTSTPSIYATLTVNKNGASEYSSVFATNANSTAALYVGVGGSSVGNTALRNNAYVLNASASDLILGTNDTERMRISSTGNVGIGTSAPSTRLQVVGGGQTTSIANAATTSTSRFDVANPSISLGIGYVGTDIPMLQSFNNGTNGATNLTINPFGGSVGIGTTSPAYKLEVNGNAYCTDLSLPAAGGIYFDNAASKYLDDYEVGTWTMGVSFGGASTGVTYTANTGNYTKIGRQVNVTGWLRLSNKGSSTGTARITGLPFTNGASSAFYTAVNLGYVDKISFADVPYGYVEVSATTIYLGESTNAGVLSDLTEANFANDSSIMINATYYV